MRAQPLILASASPRRRDLLEHAGVDFEVRPADLSELGQPGESPRACAERLAGEKALAVAGQIFDQVFQIDLLHLLSLSEKRKYKSFRRRKKE